MSKMDNITIPSDCNSGVVDTRPAAADAAAGFSSNSSASSSSITHSAGDSSRSISSFSSKDTSSCSSSSAISQIASRLKKGDVVCKGRWRKSKPHRAHDKAWDIIRSLQSSSKLAGDAQSDGVGVTDFKILRRVGRGDIGSVYLAQFSGRGQGQSCLFAMKVMDMHALWQRNKIQRVQNERQILELLDHPFLPTLYAHFENHHFSYLITEFCPGGDLHALRQKQCDNRFSLKATRFYAAEVVVALEYLHTLGVVYRDLKPENVLVREDGHIMLTDFDLSLKCEVSPKLYKRSSLSTPNAKKKRKATAIAAAAAAAATAATATSSSATVTSTSAAHGCLKQPQKPLTKAGTFLRLVRRRCRLHFQRSCLLFLFGKGKGRRRKGKRQPEEVPVPVFPDIVVEPSNARSMSFVGTHEYLAPEIILGQGHGSAVDWWTLGILLYELLFGHTPFKGNTNHATLNNIIKQPLKFPEDADIEVGQAARSLIQVLLIKDPRKRLGSQRGSAEVKQHPFFKAIKWPLIRRTKPPSLPQNAASFKPVNVAANTNSISPRKKDVTHGKSA